MNSAPVPVWHTERTSETTSDLAETAFKRPATKRDSKSRSVDFIFIFPAKLTTSTMRSPFSLTDFVVPLPEMHRMSDHPRSEAWFLETGFDSDDVTGPSSPTTESRTSGDASPTAELKDELAAFGASELVGFSCPEVTISVPVPTSDHVAEIVGKQGTLWYSNRWTALTKKTANYYQGN